MTKEIFPLFGDFWSPFDHEPSLDPDESAHVNAQIENLDPMLDAPRSYHLLRQHLNQNVSTAESLLAARILERFLIWCFFVKRKSVLLLGRQDLLEYCIFNADPPSSLIRARLGCKRFLRDNGVLVANPNWGPFSKAKYISPENTRIRLNSFYRYLTKHIGYTVNLPKKLVDRHLHTEAACEDFSAMAEKYFQVFLEHGSSKDTREYKRRFHEEKKLFILSTCYLLKISFFELLKVVDDFSMSTFRLSSNGWFLSIPGALGDLNRVVPPEYLEYLSRYRAHLGLGPIPGDSETTPIFKSRAHAESLMSGLPSYEGLKTPGRIFHKLQPIWERELATTPPDDIRTSRRPNYRPKIDRLEYFAQDHIVNEAIPPILLDVSPPPLCYFFDKKNPSAMEVDYFKIQRRMATVLNRYDFEVEPLQLFASYANSVAGQKSRLKVRAFEKLALWSCMVNELPVSQMTVHDVEAFYIFCVSPPLNWRIVKGNPKRYIVEKNTMLFPPNPEWRPFKIAAETEYQSSLRAGRVIFWCDAVMQDLLIDEKVDHNVFTMFAKSQS
ncbi:hypothetical protein ABNP32_12610 [Pseudomonas viridiflava]|uniref:hypothetical protein n=1 Tax=Pseudomonas taiwanensis TaxID=470150 RepID=UPI0028DE12B6|nr:hypothetical protein [Pseudomonas taiwanensis]MDT8923325.1 hypothetical protein [Pseudomonas taiwanensis]